MATYLTSEKKSEIFKTYGASEKDTGSTEAQIALNSFRINSLADHLRKNTKDNSSRRALLTLVGRRRKMLNYLAKKDIKRYRSIIEKLGIRK